MEYRLLGPLEVRRNGREVLLAPGKQRALLALLVLHRNQVVSVDRLVEELWGEDAPANATKSVQVYVSQLRKALGESIIRTQSPGYVLEAAASEVDVSRFEADVARARGSPPRDAAGILRDALRLWRGQPLADFTYDNFAQSEIARLDELRLSALEERIDADLMLGRHAALVPDDSAHALRCAE